MKPATLTSALLTRKGKAQPTLASPPRSAAPMPMDPRPVPNLPLLRTKAPPPSADDWQDYIYADRFAGAPHTAFHRRIHVSLRLDPGRHLRLRLEAARTGRSMQSLLLQALDEFLGRDRPGTIDGHTAHNGAHGKQDIGNRREAGQSLGAERDGGSIQPR